jgi:YesN/AraC family two-component response regulator
MVVPLLLAKLRENGGITQQLRSFTQSTGIPLRISDFKGREVWQSDIYQKKNFFCHLSHGKDGKDGFCQRVHKKALRESIRWGEATIRTCCHSLMQVTAPIMNHGRLVGSLIASPFLLVDASELQPDELSSFYKGSGKKQLLEKAIFSIPVVKDEEANQSAKSLFRLAEALSDPDLSCLRAAREIQELQGKIVDQILDFKALDKDFNPQSLSRLFYEQEREIIAKIRLGDRVGAKEILHRLLAIVLSEHLENFELLKISILELLIILTRAAVEAGTKIEEVLGMRYRFITESAAIKNQEDLCIWVAHLLEKLMDGIYQTRHAKNYQRLEKTLSFIEAHYHESITVGRIAKEVCLSPSRLSHIVKDELGITLRECVSKMRVDKAKNLLREKELPISQIALEVGYPDQSYFTKVFKKVEKCTPKTYRERAA